MLSPESHLIEMASQSFGVLSPAELNLLRSAVLGEVADCASELSDDKLQVSSEWNSWDIWRPERAVRAKLIRWLCTHPDASKPVDQQGIQLLNARVE